MFLSHTKLVHTLQAMEEDVAALATPSAAPIDLSHAQPGLSRQDSARELDESARSPSPAGRATSSGNSTLSSKTGRHAFGRENPVVLKRAGSSPDSRPYLRCDMCGLIQQGLEVQ